MGKIIVDVQAYRWRWLMRVLSQVPNLNDRLPCWEWQRRRDAHGYGKFSFLNRTTSAHRFVYETIYGPTDLLVLHKCDNPSCFNPAHLFAGTQNDNVQDCVTKGRNTPPPCRRGEQHPRCKLSDAQVISIRKRALAGEVQKSLAKEFGVSQSQISWVCKGGRKV